MTKATKSDMVEIAVAEILVPSGEILRASGPLHHADPQDPESVENYLVNQDADDNLAGAAWLAEELKKW